MNPGTPTPALRSDRCLLAAGALAAFTGAVHVLAGTPEIQQPLLTSSLPQSVSLLLLACWHLVSVALLVSAAALLWLAGPARRPLAAMPVLAIAFMWLLFGLVFIVIALEFQGVRGLLTLPQWSLLVPVGLLSGWSGLRMRPHLAG